MQRVPRSDRFVGMEMKPAFLFGVPANRQHLIAAAGKFGKVLLQRCDAERVLDWVFFGLAVRVLRRDPKFAITLEHSRNDAEMLERLILKIAEYCLGSRFLHRLVMMRASPGLVFLLMAFGTGFTAGIACGAPLRLRNPPIGQNITAGGNEQQRN